MVRAVSVISSAIADQGLNPGWMGDLCQAD
jgi:hypothetical protein